MADDIGYRFEALPDSDVVGNFLASGERRSRGSGRPGRHLCGFDDLSLFVRWHGFALKYTPVIEYALRERLASGGLTQISRESCKEPGFALGMGGKKTMHFIVFFS